MISGSITSGGFVVPYEPLKKQLGAGWEKLIRKLTLTSYPKVGAPKKVSLYKIVKHGTVMYIYMPRSLALALVQAKIITSVSTRSLTLHKRDLVQDGELFANQLVVVDYLIATHFTPERAVAGTATALLDLKAGQGKTFVAAGLIARLGVRTLYVVPTVRLASQAIKDINSFLLNSPASRYAEDSTSAVDVIVINSAIKLQASVYKSYSLVILDEVHLYCSPERRAIFKLASTLYVLGMSATTKDRADGFDKIAELELACGGLTIASALPGYKDDSSETFDCRLVLLSYYGPEEHTRHLTHESTGMMFTHYMHNQFLRDNERTNAIVDEIVLLYDWVGDAGQRHSIYVFAEEIELLRVARDAVVSRLTSSGRTDIVKDTVSDDDLTLFVGGDDARAEAAAERARILFATYGFAGTGISILRMSAIVFLTPRKANMKQILARILRRGSDVSIPRVVVDVIDRKTAMANQYRMRKIAYELYGFKGTKKIVKARTHD